MSKRNERTAADEARFYEQLRREEPIKTEVIVELREQNKRLLENQQRTLTALIEYGDLLAASIGMLRAYRLDALRLTERAIEDGSHCLPGCQRHEWHSIDGWHRNEPK